MGRFFYNIWDEYVAFNCRRNYTVMVGLIVMFAFGVVLGIVMGGRGFYTDLIFEDSVNYAIIVVNGKVSFFGMVARAVFINLRIFFVVFLFSLTVYFIPLQFLFVIYRGYILGAAVVVFTAVLGVSGFATALILIIPQQGILLICIGLYMMFSWYYTVRMGRYGCRNSAGVLLKAAICLFLLSLISIVLQSVLIYVIIRPFNLLI